MSRRFVSVFAFVGLVIASTIQPASYQQALAQQTGCQTFEQTREKVCGKFLQYWVGHGGLMRHGFPISEEFTEVSDVNGKPYTVQYFERSEFELHPENAGTPYEVLLSLLGRYSFNAKYAKQPPPSIPHWESAMFFPQTRHYLGGKFRDYWNSHGGLSQFGYPLSDQFDEVSTLNGKTYTVQYFERAVFELHTENQPPYDVLLSQLGTFQFKRKYPTGPAGALIPTPAPQPLKVSSIALESHAGPVRSIAWSPDGSLLAAGPGSDSPAGATDYGVRLWRAGGTLLAVLPGHTGPVYSLAWSPDGKTLASGSADGMIRLWSADGAPLRTIDTHAGTVFALAWSPDGQTLASGAVANPGSNTVELWRADGTLRATLSTQYSGGKFYNLAWSPDGRLLLGGATDYKLWRADGTEVFHKQECASCTPAWAMAWSPDSKAWAIGNESGEVLIYSTEGNQIARMYHSASVNSLAWSPDGRILAGGDAVALWRPDGTLITTLRADAGGVNSLAWSPDGRILAAGADNATVRLWSAQGSPLARLAHESPVVKVAWSPDGKTLAAAAGTIVRLWKLGD